MSMGLDDRDLRDLSVELEIVRQMARYWAAQRRQVPGRCAVCGAEFVATTRRMYCSNRCAVRAYRQRKRGQQDGQGA